MLHRLRITPALGRKAIGFSRTDLTTSNFERTHLTAMRGGLAVM